MLDNFINGLPNKYKKNIDALKSNTVCIANSTKNISFPGAKKSVPITQSSLPVFGDVTAHPRTGNIKISATCRI